MHHSLIPPRSVQIQKTDPSRSRGFPENLPCQGEAARSAGGVGCQAFARYREGAAIVLHILILINLLLVVLS